MNNYKIIGRIGQGAHGYVMKGLHKIANREVALKKIVIKTLAEGIPVRIMREITALRVLKSEYIVQLLDVIPHGMGLVLVMEFLPASLLGVLKDGDNRLEASQIKCYMKMLLSGVSFMHANNIMHRDLKPANLLIANSGTLKIADLGLARIFVGKDDSNERQYSHQVATRWYRAPELLYGSRNYTTAVDMWAVGCILAEMLLRRPLFPGESDIEQLVIVLRTLGTPTEQLWPGLSELPDYNKITFARSAGVTWEKILPDTDADAIGFVRGFIQYNESKRLTPKQALRHSYFHVKPPACSLDQMPKPKNIKPTRENPRENFDEILTEFEKLTKEF